MKVKKMLFDDFYNDLKKADFHLSEAENKKPINRPYLICLKGIDKSIYADGIPVIKKAEVIVELYTDKCDVQSQKKLEDWFLAYGYNRYELTERTFILNENCYVTAYKIIII